MKKVAVITSTRAEFGLLKPVIGELRAYGSENLSVELVVTGTHLSADYGNTIEEIKASAIDINHCIEIPVKSDSAQDISDNQAEILRKFTCFFIMQRYNGVVILGDRYEMLAIAIAAGNTGTPIFHLCGGDTTEGAMDEWIRHSITKMSYMHFVTNKESYARVIQLGENPERVFLYGSTSVDNIIKEADMTKAEALNSIGLKECNYVVSTYHPVTMADYDVDWQMNEFLAAVRAFPQFEFIVTKSNADKGGAHINSILDAAAVGTDNLHVFSSLGIKRYLSLMKHSKLVLGNSSSGIIEAPVFKVPTVNIGERQKGRLQAESVINCGCDRESIINAIHKALSREFAMNCKMVISPYGDGDASVKIAAKIIEVIKEDKINLQKKFYDIR